MTAEEKLLEAGYEGTVIFKDFGYDSALVGVTYDGRAVYDYGLMIEYLEETEGMSEEEAEEWIDYNTLRALPYAGENAPIVLYRIE